MKAQVQARVLIYVLAIFIAGMILLYGYNVVRNLLYTQENVQLLDFKKGVQDQIEELTYAFRDVRENRYKLPSRFTSLCIADTSKYNVLDKIPANYTLIRNSIGDGVSKNVFLLEDNRMADAFTVGTVEVFNDFRCFTIVNGQVKLRFEALGRAVDISSW
jgi:hypothetical protein